jgi:hypothetical protein
MLAEVTVCSHQWLWNSVSLGRSPVGAGPGVLPLNSHPLRTSERALIWKLVFVVKDLKMKSSWIRMGPKSGDR